MLTKRIFLASSSELKEDRKEFEIFINRKNKDLVNKDAFLELVVWEDFLDALSKTRLQDEYNKRIRECDVFVMLFCTKVGRYTEEEFETAFGQFKATNKPFIFTYFKDAEISTGSVNKKDLMSLWAFQKKLDALEHFYTPYKNIDGLKFHFSQQLEKLAASGFIELKPDKDGAAASGGTANQANLTASGLPALSSDRRQNTSSVKLLCATLLKSAPDSEDFARRLAGQIASLTGLSGQGLFDAISYFIEYHLLTSKEPEVQSTLDLAAKDKDPAALANRLREFGKTGASDARPIDVLSDFFNRTREREPVWKSYFDAVTELGEVPRELVKSVSRIRVKLGFVAPQYLLAGLLARFDDDWRPVLNAYQRAIPRPAERNGAFESLQASQWNCWLMWGPSVPICCCGQWRGLIAFQYGYGDENNSVPVLEVPTDAAASTKALDEIASKLCVERRGARFAALTGRLRWGPWFLREEVQGKSQEQEFDLAKQDEVAEETEVARLGVAPAQSTLYNEEVATNLVFQLDKIDATNPETRVYFSAYLWLIFLVAVPPRKPKFAAAGPSLLRGKEFPDWPENDKQRRRVRDTRLWEDLVPVFVHANIGDPAALSFQKQVLVENALQLLHQVWDRRHELFDQDDVAAGIQFHLVCTSDYSGCGAGLRFPPEDPLLGQLRRRQGSEPDEAFAAALMLPPDDETEATRPWGLAGYFSACHFPELIADYYDYVAEKA